MDEIRREIPLNLTGKPAVIFEILIQRCPAAREALQRSRRIPAKLLPYQAAALYLLATQYKAGPFLDIGTFMGYSASLLAQAAPRAPVITLNPDEPEARQAHAYLAAWPKIALLPVLSWDYLGDYGGPDFEMIFVDGNHRQVRRDLPWFNRLQPGGLLLFHDYSPLRSTRVVASADELGRQLGRPADVLLVDSDQTGMVGWYRREGEAWNG